MQMACDDPQFVQIVLWSWLFSACSKQSLCLVICCDEDSLRLSLWQISNNWAFLSLYAIVAYDRGYLYTYNVNQILKKNPTDLNRNVFDNKLFYHTYTSVFFILQFSYNTYMCKVTTYFLEKAFTLLVYEYEGSNEDEVHDLPLIMVLCDDIQHWWFVNC